MDTPFSKVAILGGSSVSGALALALQRQAAWLQGRENSNVSLVWAALHGESPRLQVKLWCRGAEDTQEAIALGIDATNSLKDAVANADLLVLAAPVCALARLIPSALDAGLPAGCMITDLASAKQKTHEVLRDVLHGHAQVFIGSHPVLSSGRGGIESASAHVLEGMACMLTNDEEASTEHMERLEAFWQGLGCHTAWLSAAVHDALVARVSHLPRILAAAASHVCLRSPEWGSFDVGLSGVTQVVADNPEMWTQVLSENRAAIDLPLRELISELQHIHRALESSDQDEAWQWLTAAKDRRDRFVAYA